jgi:hypothetical protein
VLMHEEGLPISQVQAILALISSARSEDIALTLSTDKLPSSSLHPRCSRFQKMNCRFKEFSVGMEMPSCLFRTVDSKVCISCARRDRRPPTSGELADLTQDTLINEENLPISQVHDILRLIRTLCSHEGMICDLKNSRYLSIHRF